jgi:hypothetical protein
MPTTALTPPGLPSASSALQLAGGDFNALPLVALHTLLRAGIIETGLYLSGQRRRLFKTALVSSLAIEVFVLSWAIYQTHRKPA